MLNPRVEVSCKNVLRPRTVFACEDGLKHRCLKIESEKNGTRGHGTKSHGKKDAYSEFTLYFEGRNLSGTVYNSENPEMFKKRKRSAVIKPIIVHKGLWQEQPNEIKH